MQRITIISVGRLKEDFFKKAEQEYVKRLNGYCNLNIIEVPQVQLPQNPAEGEIKNALKTEAENIFAKIPKGTELIALCIEGKHYSSEGLAKAIQENATFNGGNMAFVIGGSFGLDENIKLAAKIKLSMSDMTFPHRLARIMLLEQIYRAYQISANTHYHK